MLEQIIVVGFGAFFAVQLVKRAWPGVVRSGIKLFLVLLFSNALSLLESSWGSLDTSRHEAVLAFGAAGFAVMVHKTVRHLSLSGDHHITDQLKSRR